MRLPLTVRLMFHGLRAALVGGVILATGWVAFIPATRAEAEALGFDGITRYPDGLREMRAAKIFVTIASDPAYDLAARVIGPEVKPWMLKLVLTQVAAGNVPKLPDDGATSDRTIDGPRFIQVD